MVRKLVEMLTTTDPQLRVAIAITLGAVPGALSRYYLGGFVARWLGTDFPYGTLIINLTGAMVMGFFVTYILDRSIAAPDLRGLIAVGFLGSYTTFSTYALETVTLARSGNYAYALLYWAGSAVLGVLSLELGSWLAQRSP